MLPLARALRTAGHEVTFASGKATAATVAAAGCEFVRAGLDEPEMMAEALKRLSDVPAPSRGITMFATIAAPALLRDLLLQLDRLAPDLVIFEEGEWGAPLLAAVAGIPSVAHGWGAPLWTHEELDAVATATEPLWNEYSLAPASPAGLFDGLYLDTCPPPLQRDAARLAHRRTLRFEPFDSGEAAPPWLARPRARPLVYVTLGTVPTFNSDADFIAEIAAALGDLDADGLVTVGFNNDPNELGPLPENVAVVQHVSQVQALDRSSVAVTHGGAGSTLAALAFGVPVLIAPRGAPSQQRLAAACAAEGAGRVLQPDEPNAATIRHAVQTLLEDPSYRAGAERIRASIEAQPTVDTIVWELEALARTSERPPAPARSGRRERDRLRTHDP